METVFYVLNENFEKIDIVDTYISLMWCKRYYDIGALDLVVEANKKNISLFKKGNYIIREDDSAIFRIEAVEVDTKADLDNSLIIGAVDCKKILSQRIIANTINFYGFVQDYIVKMINENVIDPEMPERKIENFKVVTKTEIKDVIKQQTTYDNLAEKIIDLCKTFHLGWEIFFDNGNFCFSLFKGTDRSETTIFSIENDNLTSSKYTENTTEYKNTALVGGEGEGKDRKRIWVGEANGLKRFETFVDDSSSSTDLEQIDYLQQLKSKGYEKLADKSVIASFEGEVDIGEYKYKEQFQLGDIVAIRNEYGIETKARITEIVETWDDDGYTLEPKFEYDEFQVPVTTIDKLKKQLISEIRYTQQDLDIVYNASDHPYGLTLELISGNGENGKDGVTNIVPAVGVVPNVYTGAGGAGGLSGLTVSLFFKVDDVEYFAMAEGGNGGGGGAGGAGERDLWTIPAGSGGLGSKGDTVTINIVFQKQVKLTTFMKPIASSSSGTQGESGLMYYHDGNGLVYDYKDGGMSADGNLGEKGTSEKSGDGADASPPKNSYSTYPNVIIENNSPATAYNDVKIKVYSWSPDFDS